MGKKISVIVNGNHYENEIETRLLLVHYIRNVLNLTGTHLGCDTSQCGACTVIVDGRAVKSCTKLAVQVDGREILTVEGLGDKDKFHPVQEGFWEEHGLQCGFCTPGMLMTAYQILERNSNPTEDEIRNSLNGNLCRCTGYHNIVKAIQHAAGLKGG